MNLAELTVQCVQKMAYGGEVVVLTIPRGWRPPPGFPRGYLLCENQQGERVRSYSVDRMMTWLTNCAGVVITQTPDGCVVDDGVHCVDVAFQVVGDAVGGSTP